MADEQSPEESEAGESLGALDRGKHEDPKHHRALLLFAMQDPRRRSLRAVARALNTSESTIRGWSRKERWDARIDAEGEHAEIAAVSLYRLSYLRDFGTTEVPEIAPNMTIPISAQAPKRAVPPPVLESDLAAADKGVREAITARKELEASVRAKHLKLVDVGLGYIVRELEKNNIRASLKDIPVLLDARARLSGDVSAEEETARGGNAIALETVRVRHAREQGADLLDAIAEDLQELSTIIEVLQVRRDEEIRAAIPSAATGTTGAPDLRLVRGEGS